MSKGVKGRKFDGGKPRWDLLPFTEVEDVVDVMTFGSIKYEDDNWKYVPNGENRYFAAALRHITHYKEGRMVDPESGKHPLSHATCDLIMALWHIKNKENKNESKTVRRVRKGNSRKKRIH